LPTERTNNSRLSSVASAFFAITLRSLRDLFVTFHAKPAENPQSSQSALQVINDSFYAIFKQCNIEIDNQSQWFIREAKIGK